MKFRNIWLKFVVCAFAVLGGSSVHAQLPGISNAGSITSTNVVDFAAGTVGLANFGVAGWMLVAGIGFLLSVLSVVVYNLRGRRKGA